MRDITRPEVWAPNADMVEVIVDDAETIMARGDDGWWWSEPLPPGTLYQFRIDGGMLLPDPRSLSQPDGPHGPSRIVDPALFDRPATFSTDLRGAVGYELHIGTFTPEGTFEAAITRLDHLVNLGVQAVEVMPVADFPGEQGWGYDGVGQYAVHAAYGGPEGFVAFIDACHARGLGVILDVVHNHQGPEGNYLAQFGPYFTSAHHTPWGDAINLDQPGSSEVRDFLLGACRQWLVKYQVDGLRLDAVHEFQDDSPRHYLAELSDETRAWERETGREFTLFAESDRNQPTTVSPVGSVPGALGMDGQWADDIHHALHSFFTGERDGYYIDFGTAEVLQQALTRVFIHEGGFSTFRGQDGRARRPHLGVVRRALVRGLAAEPRPGGQPGRRRPDLALHPARLPGSRGGAVPAVAVHPVDLHGRGVGRLHAVPVLQPPRPGPGSAGDRGSRPRVRTHGLGRGDHPGPAVACDP